MNLLSTRKLSRMYRADIRKARSYENRHYPNIASDFYARAKKIEVILIERGVKIV